MRLVEATYNGTVLRTMHGRTDKFHIKVGLQQRSGLNPFLLIVLLGVISEEFRCELLFADDLTDTEEEMPRGKSIMSRPQEKLERINI